MSRHNHHIISRKSPYGNHYHYMTMHGQGIGDVWRGTKDLVSKVGDYVKSNTGNAIPDLVDTALDGTQKLSNKVRDDIFDQINKRISGLKMSTKQGGGLKRF